MSQLNLEAEQIVGEEEESSSGRRREGARRKTLVIFGAIIVVEALALFFCLEVIQKTPSNAAAGGLGTSSIEEFTTKIQAARLVPVGPVSILDESDLSTSRDRHFSFTFEVQLEKRAYDEIKDATEDNPAAMSLVQRVIEREIKNWMLDVGGQALKDKEMQRQLERKLEEYLNDRIPALSGRILAVYCTDFDILRY